MGKLRWRHCHCLSYQSQWISDIYFMGLGYDQVERERKKNRFSRAGFEPGPLAQRVRTLYIMPRPLGPGIIVPRPPSHSLWTSLLVTSSLNAFLPDPRWRRFLSQSCSWCWKKKAKEPVLLLSHADPDKVNCSHEDNKLLYLNNLLIKEIRIMLLQPWPSRQMNVFSTTRHESQMAGPYFKDLKQPGLNPPQ